jgi:hypothetical protein
LVGKALEAHDLAVPEPEDVGLVCLDGKVAAAPNADDASLDDDRLTEVGELERLPTDLRPDLLQHAPEVLACLPASIGLLIDYVLPAVQLEVGRQACPKVRGERLRVDELVAGPADRVDHLVVPPHERDVLLRHRTQYRVADSDRGSTGADLGDRRRGGGPGDPP